MMPFVVLRTLRALGLSNKAEINTGLRAPAVADEKGETVDGSIQQITKRFSVDKRWENLAALFLRSDS